LKLIADDNKYKGPVARSAAEKHIFQDKASAAFCVGSTPSIAAAPIYNKNRVLFFTAGSATPKIIGAGKPFVFNIWEGRAVTNLAYWRWANQERGVKTIAMIYPNDDAGRLGLKINTDEIYPMLGIKSVLAIPVEREDVDFTAAIARAMAQKPDAINFSGSPGQTALFAKQSGELGYKGERICEIPVDAKRVTEVAGKAGNGLIAASLFDVGPLMTPAYKELIDEYKAAQGQMDVMIDAYKMMITIWRAAVEKVDSLDPDKIVRALETMELRHPLGEARFIGKELWGADRQAIYPFCISEVRDGTNYSVGVLPAEQLYQDFLERANAKKK